MITKGLLCLWIFALSLSSIFPAHATDYSFDSQITPRWKLVKKASNPGCLYLAPTHFRGIIAIKRARLKLDYYFVKKATSQTDCGIERENVAGYDGYFQPVSEITAVSDSVLKIRIGQQACLLGLMGPPGSSDINIVSGQNVSDLSSYAPSKRCDARWR